MNIWQWVFEREDNYRNEDPELSNLIENFPVWVVNLEEQKVESSYPVALQKCRTLKDTWLEVYFRHWYMQMHIFQKMRVNALENEVVDLLNFAHKEQNADCPQSICVVQDFCHFYGLKDGPGYIEERKQIARETLEKISPDRNCFRCITSEYVGALHDEKKFDEIVAVLDRQRLKMLDFGEKITAGLLDLDYAQVYNARGEYEKSIQLLKNRDFEEYGVLVYRQSRALYLAEAYAATGRGEDAEDLLPLLEDISTSKHAWWIKVRLQINHALGETTDKRDLDHYRSLAEALEDNGVYRTAFDLNFVLYREYFQHGHKKNAADLLAATRSLSQKLRYPEQAAVEIDELESQMLA